MRGWTAALVVDGGADLWRLWRRLAPVLTAGLPVDRLDTVAGTPAVREAIRTLIAELSRHEMLVTVPAGWPAASSVAPPPAVVNWLEAVARSPEDAWERIRTAQVSVHGVGPVAETAARALVSCGIAEPVRSGPGTVDVASGVVNLSDGVNTVVGGAGAAVGFVGWPCGRAEALAAGARLARRLNLGPADDVPYPLAALVGGAAAHRLVCAVAGLRDPATEAALLTADAADTPSNDLPAVLVARAAPLNAAYHPWAPAGPPLPAATVAMLADALRRLDVLCDNELGLLPAPHAGELPQLPAALASCDTGNGPQVGYGATTGGARLDAALRTAAGKLRPSGACAVAVGADRRHADGLLLRRAAAALAARRTPVAPDHNSPQWTDHAAARHWWKALTLRFAVPATMEVRALAGNAFLARIWSDGRLQSWALEATAGDAVAFAALSATGARQAALSGLTDPVNATTWGATTTCGASPPAIADPVAPPWGDPWWRWPDVGDAEDALQRRLRRIVPAARLPRPVERPDGPAGELLDALTAVGWAVSMCPV